LLSEIWKISKYNKSKVYTPTLVGFTLYLLYKVFQNLRKQIKGIVPRFFVYLPKQKPTAEGYGNPNETI
jgi:hypothetical protein